MTVSFIHRGDRSMASFRYRAEAPQSWLGGAMNDLSADTLVFSKPQPNEVVEVIEARQRGQRVIIDYCDDHFGRFPHYLSLLRIADEFTCPTEVMRERLRGLGAGTVTAIPEAYEYARLDPHCSGSRLLWFGHRVNMHSLARILPSLVGHDIKVVSNAPGCIPWSVEAVQRELSEADIVVLPSSADYKSPNRAVEAIQQGCFVVAEPHPALARFPIWKGNIGEGVEWASKHQDEANSMTLTAQLFVETHYSPPTLASAWKRLLMAPSHSTSDAGESDGPAGSDAIKTSGRTLDATSANSRFPPIMRID